MAKRRSYRMTNTHLTVALRIKRCVARLRHRNVTATRAKSGMKKVACIITEHVITCPGWELGRTPIRLELLTEPTSTAMYETILFALSIPMDVKLSSKYGK